jgi:hypothetical protein
MKADGHYRYASNSNTLEKVTKFQHGGISIAIRVSDRH